jgi:hypothetical protein
LANVVPNATLTPLRSVVADPVIGGAVSADGGEYVAVL